MIPLKEGYRVWTKRIGNSPMKVLLLHGGPSLTHEYMECFESFFPQAGIEFYYYDQLGSYYSDQPEEDDLWTIERFVEEVEQVRLALGLDNTNFYLLGSSWGGMLAMEYALKYQDNLKGLIISNMTASFPKYAAYNALLRSQMDQSVLDRLESYESRDDLLNPEYQELVFNEYYMKHLFHFFGFHGVVLCPDHEGGDRQLAQPVPHRPMLENTARHELAGALLSGSRVR